jgi:hypothetical protein
MSFAYDVNHLYLHDLICMFIAYDVNHSYLLLLSYLSIIWAQSIAYDISVSLHKSEHNPLPMISVCHLQKSEHNPLSILFCISFVHFNFKHDGDQVIKTEEPEYCKEIKQMRFVF